MVNDLSYHVKDETPMERHRLAVVGGTVAHLASIFYGEAPSIFFYVPSCFYILCCMLLRKNRVLETISEDSVLFPIPDLPVPIMAKKSHVAHWMDRPGWEMISEEFYAAEESAQSVVMNTFELLELLCLDKYRKETGKKEFWLEKYKGRLCMSISSKALLITGIDDRRYWNYIPTEESRFHLVAYLQQTWWFEVGGEIEFNFPPGIYSLYFRLHLGRASRRLGRRICSTDHVHGWDIKPVRFQLWTSDGQHALCQCNLDDPGCWIRYHVGDFVIESTKANTKVKFSMKQIDCTHTKGGLCVDSVLICPKGLRQ